MKEQTRKKVDTFLIKHGYDVTELETDEKKLQALYNIYVTAGGDKDYEEIKRQNQRENGVSEEKLKESREDFLKKYQNLELIEQDANRYIRQIKFERHEERKLVIKQKIQKILSLLK